MTMFVFAMFLATQVSRLSPIAFSRLKLAKGFESWLGHVPIAILSALVVPEFFYHGEASGLQVNWLFVAVGVFCMGVGYVSKNLLLTTFAGIFAVAVFRFF